MVIVPMGTLMKKLKKTGLSSLKLVRKRRPATSRPPTPKVDRLSNAPILSGSVQGKKASEPEEILARVLNRFGKRYSFRWTIPVIPETYGLRGEKEVDFVISDGQLKPVQVADMEFVHRGPEQQQKDRDSDLVVNRYFASYGGVPVVWVDAVELVSEPVAEFTAKRLGLV